MLLLVFWELLGSRTAPAFPSCAVGVERVCCGGTMQHLIPVLLCQISHQISDPMSIANRITGT